MKAFAYGVWLQWKIDFRKKDVLMMYYIMPLAFFLFMGGIFSSIDPGMKQTLAYACLLYTSPTIPCLLADNGRAVSQKNAARCATPC